VNNYGYETKSDERKFILERIESIPFFTGFVECQEQGFQQQNKKNEKYEHLLRKHRERFPDANKN
jgi:hypothetical protein